MKKFEADVPIGIATAVNAIIEIRLKIVEPFMLIGWGLVVNLMWAVVVC